MYIEFEKRMFFETTLLTQLYMRVGKFTYM